MVKTAFLTTPGFGFSLWESLFPLAVAAIGGAFVGAIGLSANAFVTGWSAAGDVETGKSGAMRRRRTRKGTGEKAICCELLTTPNQNARYDDSKTYRAGLGDLCQGLDHHKETAHYMV